MADKTDMPKLLESLEKFCLEYRAWRYIALNYCLGEEPQKLFSDYCSKQAYRTQNSDFFRGPNAALQSDLSESEVLGLLLESLKEATL